MPRLTKSQMAAKLGERYRPTGTPFTERALSRWMRFHGMPHYKLGRQVSFDEADVMRWADQTFHRGQRL